MCRTRFLPNTRTGSASHLRVCRMLLQPGAETFFSRLSQSGCLRTIEVLASKVWGLHESGSISIIYEMSITTVHLHPLSCTYDKTIRIMLILLSFIVPMLYLQITIRAAHHIELVDV